jgi:Polyketide cyclase / dehydrase and lipid transport
VGARTWTVLHKPVPLRSPIELTLEQVEVQAPTRLALRQEDEASIFHVEYLLEPSAAGTRFTQVSDFEWKKLPRVLHGTFARGVRRDVRGQLRELKRLLEG